MILASLGAAVVRVVSARPVGIDADLAWGRVWDRDKEVVATDDVDQVRQLLTTADVALVYGSEDEVEGRGLGYADVADTNPALVYARCRPSRTAEGATCDFALLVEAKAGLCSQLPGHRPGPIFVDAGAASAGVAFTLTAEVLALLTQRAETGHGGWGETSLYDGMLATLGAMVGRSERAATEIERYWSEGSTYPNFVYCCSDGGLIQVWFGGKGMYGALIDVLGDEPSTEGYYTDQVNGALQERCVRWRTLFAAAPRDDWVARLRAAGVACEPVLGPGEALRDPHLLEIGLAVTGADAGHHDVIVDVPISVEALPAASPTGPVKGGARGPRSRPLEGIHVVDFSAFVAGPLAAQVLADLGADVVKVEPPEGEAMRAAAYAVAACQRGKRSLAIDLRAADAGPVVERLIKWADVVLQNFRVGVAERLGIDERTAATINPSVVYCHATAFGDRGPRAGYPGNDALMQAVTGLERAVGGSGEGPIAPTWIPIDIGGGWLAAAGILAGLYARAVSGLPQRVRTSLLGAGMLLQSGVFERDGEIVRGPALDRDQAGYGPGYRIFRAAEGEWLAMVVPDQAAWTRLRSMATALPAVFTPLRCGPRAADAKQAESVLEAVFAALPAAQSLATLSRLGIPAVRVTDVPRDGFRRAILDDPLNRQLGRVASYDTADWGRLEQIGALLRLGPEPTAPHRFAIPGVGEHSVSVLTELGFEQADVDRLLRRKVVRQLS
jgi:crotonobetainyl-CoA:carnitine CoA-transferase CaiB-like acyl-CoA transferase